VLCLVAVAWGGAQMSAQAPAKDTQAQTPTAPSAKPSSGLTTHQTVVVTANLTPEEKEEGDINEVYQSVDALQRQNRCPEAIEKYRSSVIPMAEKAKFEVPKNKFLFLAYRGIADCYLSQERFAEAEKLYQRIFQYMPVWPGKDDSDYPINLRSVGLARMGQQNWKAAEEPLQKAITVFDEQIEKAAHSDSEFARNEHANNLRMSQDIALNWLALDYFREQRFGEALALLERAYDQALKFHAPSTVVRQIVENGIGITQATGDSAAHATWARRAEALK